MSSNKVFRILLHNNLMATQFWLCPTSSPKKHLKIRSIRGITRNRKAFPHIVVLISHTVDQKEQQEEENQTSDDIQY